MPKRLGISLLRLGVCLIVSVGVFLLAVDVQYLVNFTTTTNITFPSREEAFNSNTPTTPQQQYPVNAVKARIFVSPNETTRLCIPQTQLMGADRNSPSSNGLLLVRIPKTGSSTVGGVAARMAHYLAQQVFPNNNNNNTVCQSRLTHAWSLHTLRKHNTFATRNHNTSFLWTILRNPADRALSGYYFFEVGKKNGQDAVSILSKRSNHLWKWIGGKKKAPTPQNMEQAMQEFNFMGLLERLDESLVLLQLLLRLQPEHVLYLTAKTSGSYDISNHCRQIPKVVKTPQIQEYLSSKEWFHQNHGDYMLYNAVNRSLDATIQSIGRETFHKALTTFRRLQAIANKHCPYKSPCIGEGVYRPREEEGSKCYAEDWGCGYECLDNLVWNRTT